MCLQKPLSSIVHTQPLPHRRTVDHCSTFARLFNVSSQTGGSRQEQWQRFSKDAFTIKITAAHSNKNSCLAAKTESSTTTFRCERTIDEPYESHPKSKWKTQASRGKSREDSKWDCNTTRSCAWQLRKRHSCGGSRRRFCSVDGASRKRQSSWGFRRRK